MKFILASKSPRRQDLLLRLQTPFDVIMPNVDESMIISEGSPSTYCTALAELKADNISAPAHLNGLVMPLTMNVCLVDICCWVLNGICGEVRWFELPGTVRPESGDHQ